MNNSSDSHRAPRWMEFIVELSAVAIILGIGLLVMKTPVREPRGVPATDFSAPRAMKPCKSPSNAHLNGRLYGALDLTVDWYGAALTCDGITRPNEKGIRLAFAATQNEDGDRLVFVIGIDGKFDRLTGGERKANVTIIDESSGRFFSTSGKDRCWTMIDSVESLGDREQQTFQVAGKLYCAGALPSLSGPGSITLGDFDYSGRLSLDVF
jgi:hypothetical protein